MNKSQHKPHLAFAHWLWAESIQPNSLVIDATLGNGQDAAFILKILKTGRFIGLDIQETALFHSKALFDQLQIDPNRYDLLLLSHEHLDSLPLKAKPDLIYYNLGYLPSGHKSLTTQTETTLISLEKALSLISPNGLITLTCYPGHPEGVLETKAVSDYLMTLSPKDFRISQFSLFNQPTAPLVYAVFKRVKF